MSFLKTTTLLLIFSIAPLNAQNSIDLSKIVKKSEKEIKTKYKSQKKRKTTPWKILFKITIGTVIIGLILKTVAIYNKNKHITSIKKGLFEKLEWDVPKKNYKDYTIKELKETINKEIENHINQIEKEIKEPPLYLQKILKKQIDYENLHKKSNLHELKKEWKKIHTEVEDYRIKKSYIERLKEKKDEAMPKDTFQIVHDIVNNLSKLDNEAKKTKKIDKLCEKYSLEELREEWNSLKDEIDRHIECPVCFEQPPLHEIKCVCKGKICKECAEQWFKENSHCPCCKT